MKICRFINGVETDESALDNLTLLLPALTAAIDSAREADMKRYIKIADAQSVTRRDKSGDADAENGALS